LHLGWWLQASRELVIAGQEAILELYLLRQDSPKAGLWNFLDFCFEFL
jgi:hypothetical protein